MHFHCFRIQGFLNTKVAFFQVLAKTEIDGLLKNFETGQAAAFLTHY
jgi:hypothetical protein